MMTDQEFEVLNEESHSLINKSLLGNLSPEEEERLRMLNAVIDEHVEANF